MLEEYGISSPGEKCRWKRVIGKVVDDDCVEIRGSST